MGSTNETIALDGARVGIVMASPTAEPRLLIVDAADYPKVSGLKWRLHETNGAFYAKAHRRVAGGRYVVKAHRLLLDVASDVEIDHRDRDGLNNTRVNLRPCTRRENTLNRGLQVNNKSGYRGVCWNRARGRWQAGISINGKSTYLGRYETAEQAARAYDEAARQANGEFAQLNFA